MAFAVELYFDDHTDRAIRHMWASLGAVGLLDQNRTEAQPHVSLAVADSGDPAVVADRLSAADFGPAFTLTLAHLGYFREPQGVLYLAVTPDRHLLDLHRRVWHRIAADSPGLRDYYRPGAWTPHCTLTMPVPPHTVGEAIAALGRFPLVLRARVESVGVWGFGTDFDDHHILDLRDHQAPLLHPARKPRVQEPTAAAAPLA